MILESVLRRTPVEELVERISLADPRRDVEAKNARRWLNGPPAPHNAWSIGEALRYRDEHVEAIMPGASGLLALYWFGHIDHFVGVIGCLEHTALASFEARLMAMLRTMDAASYNSPYDALPPDHDILANHADEFLLRQIADTKVIVVPLTLSYADEAAAINDRRRAREVWDVPSDLHELLCAAALRWFGDDSAKGELKAAEPFTGRARALRRAYAIARSNIDDAYLTDLVVDQLTQWFYTEAVPEPPAETGEMLHELVKYPTSRTAHAILTGFRSYGVTRE
ncbi:MAG TPA: hypothetical protein VHT05_05130 [Candidatus Elarobacter sp.]|nr:hypothetical protein [Candidatus Elarobacter sp.]